MRKEVECNNRIVRCNNSYWNVNYKKLKLRRKTVQMNNCISIIVPIYNKEKYIRRCVESLIHQTYSNIEIILVDDGSTDNSLRLCEEYKEKDHRIKVISKLNGGVSSARNTGIDASKGDLLAFVDPDDSIEKTMFTELKDILKNCNADIAYCNAVDIYNDKKIITGKNTGNKYVISSSKYEWVGPRAHTVCWGAIYRKNVINDIRFNDMLSIGEDTFFFAQCVKNSRDIVYLDKALYHYYINEDSVTAGEWIDKKNDELIAREMICKLYKENTIEKLSSKVACGVICKSIVSKYCGDEIFLRKWSMYYQKKYRKYAIYLIFYFLVFQRNLKLAGKALYTLLFWKSYISHQQKKHKIM